MPMLSNMTEAEKDDLGTRMLSKLIELYADQMGVTVEYVITNRKDESHGNLHGDGAGSNHIRRNGVA